MMSAWKSKTIEKASNERLEASTAAGEPTSQIQSRHESQSEGQHDEQITHLATYRRTQVIPKASQTQSQHLDPALQSLFLYSSAHKVVISRSITAQRSPGRGLGVYTVQPLKKNDRLVHVPTSALLTIQSIPETFLTKAVRQKFTVHCALAAFLAFGDEKDVQAEYGAWMDTWPRWEEFVIGLPVFWDEDFRTATSRQERIEDAKKGDKNEGTRDAKPELPQESGHEGKPRFRKRRRMIANSGSSSSATDTGMGGSGSSQIPGQPQKPVIPKFSRSLGIDDHWLTLPPSTFPTPAYHPNLSEYYLNKQSDKIRACIDTIATHLPHLHIRSPSSHALYLRFLHMWSCVNSRCFYYLPPGKTPPEDSNEAMALCPFQDLFNHNDRHGCGGVFNRKGFFVTADRDYDAGEELHLRYGKHTNDMLWMEYGFTMTDNTDDYVRIDASILGFSDWDEQQRKRLQEDGYWNEFYLRNDGVCYRTVIVSYLGVLDEQQWRRMVAGGFDPEVLPTLSEAYTTVRLPAKRKIVTWILRIRKEAEENLKVLLLHLEDENVLIAAFVGETADASLTKQQRASQSFRLGLARKRRDMCIRRWEQIFDMAMSALREVEDECPGSFIVDGEPGRTGEELEMSAAQFVKSLSPSLNLS